MWVARGGVGHSGARKWARKGTRPAEPGAELGRKEKKENVEGCYVVLMNRKHKEPYVCHQVGTFSAEYLLTFLK